MDLPMAMRFRKLKEHAREAVGVYRYQSNIYVHVPSESLFYLVTYICILGANSSLGRFN